MNLRARVGWTALGIVVAVLLASVFLAGVTASSAFAEDRGKSGLPHRPGNPIAALQHEIDALTQRIAELARLGQSVAALTQQLAALQQQMTALTALQQQVNGLNGQVNGLNAQLVSLNNQIVDVSARLQSIGPSNALAVFDAHDTKIGDVVGVQDEVPWVSLTAAGQVVVLRVFSGQLLGGFVWFSGANCDGTPYISDPALFTGADVFSMGAVREPGGLVYAASPKTPQQQVLVQSVAQQDGTCFAFPSPVHNTLVPATLVMTLDLKFSRPYSVH